MSDYDNDMAAIDCEVADLTEGDMVDGTPILDWLTEQGCTFDTSDYHTSDCLLWIVAEVTEERTDEGEPIAVLHTEHAGSWALPPALEVTCYPALCKGCGHHPTDCECED